MTEHRPTTQTGKQQTNASELRGELAELPPPDTRLAGKVKIVRLEPKLSAGNGSEGALAGPALGDGQAATDDDAEINRLANLGILEYERTRDKTAKQLNCRAAILDGLVKARRRQFEDDGR